MEVPRQLFITEPVQLEHIVSQAHQGPFTSHLIDTAKQKLAESPGLFDLAKDRLHNGLACSVDSLPDFGFQFASHPVHPSGILRQWPLGTGLLVFVRSEERRVGKECRSR